MVEWQNVELKKVSIRLNGHATSFSLETPFLKILRQHALANKIPLAQLIQNIDAQRAQSSHKINLSSALRVYILELIKKHK